MWILKFGFLILSAALLISGCATLERNAAQHYYKEVLWRLDELPKSTKDKCQYSLWDAPYPGFLPDKEIGGEDNRPNLKGRIIIHYNPNQKESVMHEAMHYQNRMREVEESEDGTVKKYGNVTWECLDEVVSQLIRQNIELRSMLHMERIKRKNPNVRQF